MTLLRPDAGFFYGLGVFTTIAVKKNTPLFLEAHLQRLTSSAAFFGITEAVSQEEVYAYLNDHPLANHGLRVALSPQNKTFTPRENPYTASCYQKGFALKYSTVMRNETSPFTYHKTLNCGENIREKQNAKEEGFDEPIFLNSQGEITEGATTNIFFVKNGGIFTPQLSCGLLNGILRQFLLAEYPVTEMVIHPNIVADFDECFVTNSLLGIMPVYTIENHVFPSREIATAIGKIYCQKISML